ncbi:MAG: hypothetical protein Q9208_006676 [Pyrenodesmia sp. 3 TL-2023]
MVQFSDIPPELVHQIEYQVQPDDIENLVLTSKHFYFASTPVLAEHRRLKRQYNVVWHITKAPQDGSIPLPLKGKQELSPVHHLPHLLRTIINCPRIGLYIRTIIVRGIEGKWVKASELVGGIFDSELSLDPRHSEDDFELFKSVACRFPISSTPTLEPLNIEEWHTHIDTGNQAAVLGLIILHCPNLSTFDFEAGEGYTLLNFNIFNAIDIGKSCNFLDRLRYVRFVHFGLGNGVCRPNIHHVKMLLGLPAMESIEIHNMDGLDPVEDSAPVLHQTTNVQSLTFTHCAMRNRAFFELLQANSQLKSLTLHYTTLAVHWIRAAVVAFAKDSLESLSIRAIRGLDLEKPSEGSHLGSLKPFTALRTLDVQVDILEDYSHGEIRDLNAQLPASLQSLTLDLLSRKEEDYLDGLITELELMMNANVERRVFPHLSQITLTNVLQGQLDYNSKILLKVREGFARQGVELYTKLQQP